ncbi:MAG: crosslink repair DNA glycosylase YcaQ family protein [Devosia sp.]
MCVKPVPLSLPAARRIWLAAQKLDEAEPFGSGPQATRAAIEHLGYVQIDTINVIERCHHHILSSRIPTYRRADLQQAQSVDKSVFEYWTHALAYVPTRDFRFHLAGMRAYQREAMKWYADVPDAEVSKVLRRIRRDGPLTIRDIEDDVLVEKDHAWASRKPSKRALQRAFFDGRLAISARQGMVKTYELMERHFGTLPSTKPATEKQGDAYALDRALRSQGIVSLESVCHLDAPRKPRIRALIETRIRKKELVPVALKGAGKTEHWLSPEWLDTTLPAAEPVHILSPFDPLIIQRKRLKLFFGYDHIFEAYVPREKRKFGYFALPVLVGDEIVAALDLKTDRAANKLLIQSWHWIDNGKPRLHKRRIEEALTGFEAFQLARET